MIRIPRPQDISWLLDLHEKGQLDLDPPYQRRSVWSPSDRRFFIDTILNNYPSPPIFIHRTLDDQGRPTYHVVDGKQRLETIINFTQNKIRIPDDFADASLQGKKWRDLGREQRERLWNYVIVVEMLPDVDDPYVRNVFDRINRNARKLTAQELRHAKYEGWFITTAEAEANKEEWRELGIVTTARAKRMLDVQFISELLIVIITKKIHGFDQNLLDSIYAEYDDIADHETFIEEDFTETLERVKREMRDIVRHAPDAGRFLRVQNHFYTLWSYLTLNTSDTPPSSQFALQYQKLLVEVDSMIKDPLTDDLLDEVKSAQEDPSEGLSPELSEFQRAVTLYAANIRGASTDLTPRLVRHNALVAAMTESAVNEGK